MRVGLVLAGLMLALPAQAAWFTDNGEREALSVLRAKSEDSLNAVEREILTAANRTGWVSIPGCGWGSNAVLVTVDGQDYAVTSLHLLTGKTPGDVHCEPDLDAVYMPNSAYILPDPPEEGGEAQAEWQRFTNETIKLEPAPLNFTRSGAAMPWVSDWVAYRLTRNVSDQIMPEGAWGAGEKRGSMPWSARQNLAGPVWTIGYDGRFGDENGWEVSWQECKQSKPRYSSGILYFTCDVSPGASSSLIAVMEEGRLTFQGIITASMEPVTGTDIPLPASAFMWNIGTATDVIRPVLDPEGAAAATSSWLKLLP